MLKLSEGIIIEYSEGNESFVLMDLEQGKIYKLNENAHKLLNSIQTSGSINGYLESQRGEADPDIIKRDALEYLSELQEKGYVITE